jgi:hypothetical protein
VTSNLDKKDDFEIVRTKFFQQATVVFRSDGHIDYTIPGGEMFSSRNIDFENLKVVSGKEQQ